MKRFFISLYFFIICAITVTFFGLNLLMERHVEKNYAREVTLYNQELSRGCFYLLNKELESVDSEAFATKITELQSHFGYPIALHQRESLNLTDSEQQAFLDQKIIVRDEGNLLLMRIGKGNSAVSMGPFEEVELKAIDITLYFVAAAASLGLLSLFWTIFFWKRLNKISLATNAFGEGDFSARVKVHSFSSLASLANVFNGMADRIEELISSHKDLVNAVSHELRTPISRIRFGLENLKNADKKERQKQLLGIDQDVDELENLVSELLMFARFDGMKNHLSMQKVPLVSWIKEFLKVEAANFSIPVHFTHQTLDESYTVTCDPRLLERAIHNLLQNGTRFTKSKIAIDLSQVNGKVLLLVEDDGPGIPVEDRQRIFDPFVRLESSRNRQYGGYGLGLSIVSQILRCHDGEVSVRSSDMGGAAFILSWPL